MFGGPFHEFEDPFFATGRPGQAMQPQPQHHQLHHHQQNQKQMHRSNGGTSRSYSMPHALVPIGRDARGGHLMGPQTMPGYDTFGMPQFDRLFDGVNRLMADVGARMRQAQEASNREDFDGHMYCQSSVYAYSSGSGPNAEPHVYQAVAETRTGPGGIRETRKALKDSRTRDEKVAVGRHIGGRGHTVERRRNVTTGDQQEDHHYVGIDEAEGQVFDREWDTRAAQVPGWQLQGGQHHQQRRHHHRRRLEHSGGGGGGPGFGGERRAITDGKHN